MSPRNGKDRADFSQPASSNDVNGVSEPCFNVVVFAGSASIPTDYFQDIVENGLRRFNFLERLWVAAHLSSFPRCISRVGNYFVNAREAG
jgi:hypothetical protein